MLLDLKFSIGTLGIGSGAFVAALYGMNLKNFLEESDLGFWGVSSWCAAFAVIVCMYGLTKLRKVQRVSMWGESGRRGPNWRSIESAMKHELDIGRHERMERNRRLKEERLSALEDVRSGVMRKGQEMAVLAQVRARSQAQAHAQRHGRS
jgi:magnesium transporter